MNHEAGHRPVNVTDDEQSTLTTMQARQGATTHVTQLRVELGAGVGHAGLFLLAPAVIS